MKRVLSSQLPQDSKSIELDSDEAHHLIHVLKIKSGETVEVLNGKGSKILATIELRAKKIWLHAKGKIITQLTAHPILLEMSLIKADAMEWVIEKSVELGVKKFFPVQTSHSVIQIDRKGPDFFQERWQRIANQALKQCGRLDAMEVYKPISLQECLLRYSQSMTPRFWCDEKSNSKTPFLEDRLKDQIKQDFRILIGPEGGFSEEERKLLQNAALSTHLGPSVLRAETAAIYAISVARSQCLTKLSN